MMSMPILNAPQSGILGMHRIEERPVVRNGQVVIRPMMYLALSYDHRLIDGADAIAMFVSVADFGVMIDGEWQPGSGLGAAFWWEPRPEAQRQGRGAKWELTVSARYGVAITLQDNVRKLTALK